MEFKSGEMEEDVSAVVGEASEPAADTLELLDFAVDVFSDGKMAGQSSNLTLLRLKS